MSSSPPPFDAVLFDLDGTLVDSAGDLAGAVEEMRIVRGLPALGAAAYRSMAGAGARGMLGVGFAIGPDADGYASMREEFFSNYERCITRTTAAFDGVETLLDCLEHSGIRWGIVTNKAGRFSEPLVAAMPLLGRAETLVSGDSTPYSKPHPAPLLEAARRMEIEPQRCIYVGDDERDIVAGRAAGMATAIAAWGYLGSKPALSAWGAGWTLMSPVELLKILQTD